MPKFPSWHLEHTTWQVSMYSQDHTSLIQQICMECVLLAQDGELWWMKKIISLPFKTDVSHIIKHQSKVTTLISFTEQNHSTFGTYCKESAYAIVGGRLEFSASRPPVGQAGTVCTGWSCVHRWNFFFGEGSAVHFKSFQLIESGPSRLARKLSFT